MKYLIKRLVVFVNVKCDFKGGGGSQNFFGECTAGVS
jgi:hypothetical protein